MTMLRDFVLAPATQSKGFRGGAPVTELSVLRATDFRAMMASVENGLDFGPFVSAAETPTAHLVNRRWMRIAFLLAQLEPRTGHHLRGVWWIDAPNSDLDGLTPFAATADDEAFARANALVFLTGGSPIAGGSSEEERFCDFCASLSAIGDALSATNAPLLSEVYRALSECTGSLATARLILTCGLLPGQDGQTLYRLLSKIDATAFERILRTVFGYSGRPLNEADQSGPTIG